MEKIKNYLLILLVSLGMAAAFTACSDDKDDNNYSTLIVGTWVDIDYPSYGYTFKSSGSYTYFEDYYEEKGKWTISGSTLTLDSEYDTEVYKIKAITEDDLVLEDEEGDIFEFEKK